MSDPAETEPDPPARSIPWATVAAVAMVLVGAGLVVAALVSSGDDDGSPSNALTTLGPLGSSTPSGSSDGSGATTGTADLNAGTTAPTTPEGGLGEGTVAERDGRSPLRGFGEVAVTVTGPSGEACEVCLLAASTSDQQARGLMEVTDADLGGYDGMLFEYPEPVDGSFYMRNTPMPLSIAYFDQGRVFVSATDMTPCDDVVDCPTYHADRPFRYAIEVPQGGLGEIAAVPGSSIAIGARTCPGAARP